MTAIYLDTLLTASLLAAARAAQRADHEHQRVLDATRADGSLHTKIGKARRARAAAEAAKAEGHYQMLLETFGLDALPADLAEKVRDARDRKGSRAGSPTS